MLFGYSLSAHAHKPQLQSKTAMVFNFNFLKTKLYQSQQSTHIFSINLMSSMKKAAPYLQDAVGNAEQDQGPYPSLTESLVFDVIKYIKKHTFPSRLKYFSRSLSVTLADRPVT